MKEEEVMRIHNNHKHVYRFEINHKEQKTINTNVIIEFDNLAYVSEPLSQWDFLFLFKASQEHHESANGLQQ